RIGVIGLRLRVSPTVATWCLACRDSAGRARRFSLGRYPGLSLKDARDKARAEREKIRDGADPVAEKRAKRARARAERTNTLAALLIRYEQKVGGQKRSWTKSMRPAIECVFRAALGQPLANLTRAELQSVATDYRAQGAAANAVRCLRPV